MTELRDDWLWDRSGPPDPLVRRLEERLRPLGHRGGEVPEPAPAPPRRWGRAVGIAAVLAAGVVVAVLLVPRRPAEVRLVVEGGPVLRERDRFEAKDDARLLLDRFGELTLRAGGRLQVERLDRERTRLFLERGELEAFVAPDVRPRFFQVGTPAARCVDLGCEYVLTVDDAGVATVVVSLGRVAFEHGERTVVVPFGATCRAVPGRGPGTPRYVADRGTAFWELLDRFDAASDAARRRAAAAELLAAADAEHRSLPVWHLLQDGDPEVAAEARRHLEARYGRPPAPTGEGVADARAWRRHLQPLWWPP